MAEHGRRVARSSNRRVAKPARQERAASSSSRPTAGPPAQKQKKKKTVHMSNSGWMLYIVIILLLSCLLSYFAVTMANDMFGFVKEDSVVTVTVDKEDTLETITDMLDEEGFLQYPWLFEFYVELTGDQDNFNYGTYDLNTNMTYQQIISTLQSVSKDANVIAVTIPEGFDLDDIYKRLESNDVCSYERLAETGQERPWKHSFLASDLVPMDRQNRIEGYLFPDTYNFYVGDNPVDVLNKMLNNFDSKFSEEYRARAEEIGMSIDEVVILASMIQMEAASVDEMALISSVFHNRLNGALGGYLQSDATLKYVVPDAGASLTAEQLQMDSPYNTYKYPGLPPTPICCPGLDAIAAALYPEETDYLYFVAMADGSKSLFASTAEEHEKNIQTAGIRDGE
ncbi:MAG: endolytic transglycosylase MltG [Eubacteriales bacterium]|jgi:UPF0755 protein